jgi:hypothetical protein
MRRRACRIDTVAMTRSFPDPHRLLSASGRFRGAIAGATVLTTLVVAVSLVVRDVSPSPRPAPARVLAFVAAPPRGDSTLCGKTVRWLGPSSPPVCWRPYSDTSPFNQQIPLGARLAANSARVVKRLLGFGPLQHLTAGDAGTANDYGRPTYFNHSGDPVFTVHCTEPWGTCPIEGSQVRIPDAARVPGGTDGHLSVVDQTSGWEYDFWRVHSKPAGGGRIVVAWGGRTRIDGNGLGSYAVAARFGTLAGALRPEELEAGQINHALAISVRCDSGRFVYPASDSSTPCADEGLSNSDAPAVGTRFQLAMTPAQIDALAVPAYRKTVLRAMARYGMYVADTGGSWGIITESALVTTSFGLEDRWVRLARSVGAPYWAPDHRYAIDIRDGVDWARYLRVIDPCVMRRTC